MDRSLLGQLVKRSVEEYLTRKDISQNQLARQLNISPASLVNIRKENWEKVSDNMLNTLVAHFKIDTDSWGVRRTRNYNTIARVCEDARMNSRFLAVAAYTGAGKTIGLRDYAFRAGHKNVYYVHANIMHSMKTFMADIAKALGILVGDTAKDIMDSILRKLKSDDKPLLIIDDSVKLRDNCWRLIQVIYDETEFHAGIVVAGTELMKKLIDKKARQDKVGYRELRRRIAYWQPLFHISSTEIQTICADFGIEDKQAIKYIKSSVHDYATLRDLILNARKLSQERGLVIDRELLELTLVGDHYYESLA